MGYSEYLMLRIERYGPYMAAMAALAGMRAHSFGVAVASFCVVGMFFTGLLSLLWLFGIVGREKGRNLPRLRRLRR